jgi:hypothetical protein
MVPPVEFEQQLRGQEALVEECGTTLTIAA